MAAEKKFELLSKAKIQDARNVVISKHKDGGFTMAQQLEVKEGSKTTYMYMRDAIHIDSLEGLVNLRDALNVAIHLCNAVKSEDEDVW